MLKKITLVAAASAVTAAGLAIPATSAQADTPGCVTRTEYRSVAKGWTKARVDRRFDTTGHRMAIASSGGYSSSIWNYRTCSPFSAVSISYDKHGTGSWLLTAKSAVWVS
jgi:hypothetical protein